MQPFAYTTAADEATAGTMARQGAMFIAGGTDILQLLQEGVCRAELVVDINALPYAGISEEFDGGVRIGALTRLQDAADSPILQSRCTVVAEALAATASPMVRHMATIGGNLLQRTRCLYFRDVTTPCNKREPGSGCPAQDGENRINAILGGSEHCIAVQPSDLPVALVSLDAEVQIRRADGALHWFNMEDFHLCPGSSPERETVLQAGDLVVAVRIPGHATARRSHYVKVRDRASFAWALASAAVAVHRQEDGTVSDIRIAVGGVATKPWRLRQVEQELLGHPFSAERIAAAAALSTTATAPRSGNAYKVLMLRHTVERALLEVGGKA